ncbi:MAG: hypothetical protein IT373_00695 [Polyangiaceae bacterium]|nr:hypothetical protein [Polyangiaceae bacterium]
MYGWSFHAPTPDDVGRLLRALSKHRYVVEVELRLHWAVDAALADAEPWSERARAFARIRSELDLGSRDERLWQPASLSEVTGALARLWGADRAAESTRQRLSALLRAAGIARPPHLAFLSEPDDPPHPELVLCDWELLPVDELDMERHAGALLAMERAEEAVSASEPLYQEGPVLAEPELCDGAPDGVLCEDLVVWADGPYSYSDYVFRGVARAAKLEPPVGWHDLDEP